MYHILCQIVALFLSNYTLIRIKFSSVCKRMSWVKKRQKTMNIHIVRPAMLNESTGICINLYTRTDTRTHLFVLILAFTWGKISRTMSEPVCEWNEHKNEERSELHKIAHINENILLFIRLLQSLFPALVRLLTHKHFF